MSAKRKAAPIDYSQWERLEKEIEAEESKEKDPVSAWWEDREISKISSRMLGSGGYFGNHDNFIDACSMYWHHFKMHSIVDKNKNSSKTPKITDKELERIMQENYDKAMCYFHLFEFQMKEGHLNGKLENIELVYAAIVEQKEKFCKNANRIGNWIDDKKWRDKFFEEKNKYLTQYNSVNPNSQIHTFDVNSDLKKINS